MAGSAGPTAYTFRHQDYFYRGKSPGDAQGVWRQPHPPNPPRRDGGCGAGLSRRVAPRGLIRV